MSEQVYNKPEPIINKKEDTSLVDLTERYNKLVAQGVVSKVGTKISSVIPESIKNIGDGVKTTITEVELYTQCMKILAGGISVLEQYAAKMTVSEKKIVKKINKCSKDNEITRLEEVCLVRSYDISRVVNNYKIIDIGLAFIEGGATGYFGFAGLPFNLVLSLFLYYRAVQSIAMFYGYDVKNDSAELVIASEVFIRALSPSSKGSNELSGIIGKVMLLTEMTAVKQTAKKTWSDMAARGGISLMLTQMRALANKAAQKALEKVGKKGLENNLFREIFEQIGKKLTKKAIGKTVPVAGALVGALFDTAQMNTILEYADVFYNKRYILEKEMRINNLLGIKDDMADEVILVDGVVDNI